MNENLENSVNASPVAGQYRAEPKKFGRCNDYAEVREDFSSPKAGTTR